MTNRKDERISMADFKMDTKNMTCLIGLKESVPLRALEYRIHTNALSKHLVETFRDKSHSWHDVAISCADFFADIG